jgi:hypothetical protein
MILRSKLYSPAGEGGDQGGAGSHQSTSSATSDNRVDDDSDEKPKFVSRDAYERLQKDLVKFKGRYRESESKINEFEADRKAREEAKLMEEKNFQELIAKKEQEINELKGTVGSYQARDTEAAKYNAFTDAVGQRIPDKFLPVIPFDEIKIIDGEIDKDQVKEVAGNFLSTYPEIFKRSSAGTPGDFPTGTAKKMSKAEYIAQGRVKGAKWMQQQVKLGNVEFS